MERIQLSSNEVVPFSMRFVPTPITGNTKTIHIHIALFLTLQYGNSR